jgi:hypothetical protein
MMDEWRDWQFRDSWARGADNKALYLYSVEPLSVAQATRHAADWQRTIDCAHPASEPELCYKVELTLHLATFDHNCALELEATKSADNPPPAAAPTPVAAVSSVESSIVRDTKADEIQSKWDAQHGFNPNNATQARDAMGFN